MLFDIYLGMPSKENVIKDIVPIRPDTPPSIATLGHQQLGHLSRASDPLPPIKIWDILTKIFVE